MTQDEDHGVTGEPAEGRMDVGAQEPLGRSGLRHWQQSTISKPGLDDRGSIFFAAIEMTRMPMLLTDPNLPDNPIVFANNAFFDLTLYEESEVVGQNCRFLQGPQTDREVVGQIREAVDRGEAISVELINYRKDGSSFWNAVFIGPVFDANGKLIYFFASQLDVTRRRESEASFRQAQKMESIGQLTAGLAHDFNNLLHVITGSLDRMASRRHDEASFQRYLTSAHAAAERGAKLTGQLLAFARRSRLEPQRVELGNLVTSISELLDTSVGSKLELQLNLRRRLPEIMVDPIHLEMALLNIVINARDASPEGGTITIDLREVTLNGTAAALHLRPGRYVRLSVSDEGTGMSEAVRARATEPFFTTKPVGEGTGLGLAMASGFVQQTGGRLDITSAERKGTTIAMYFPVAPGEAEVVPLNLPRFVPQPVDTENAPLILVVDDNRETVALAAETLAEVGYRVAVAYSGEEALKVYDEVEGTVSLVFTDVIMPGGMNGIVFARRIRERNATIPVLFTTGYSEALSREGPTPETNDVLGKPYRPNELTMRVQAALRRKTGGTPRRHSDFGTVEE